MKLLRWLSSGTVRQAVDMRKHVQRLLAAQRDILPAENVAKLEESIAALQSAIDTGASKADLIEKMRSLDEVGGKCLKPFPHASYRENVEVVLVALAVAICIRTFFLQPFKIPTGSMQPTLYGITHENLLRDPASTYPNRWQRWFDLVVHGISYYEVIAKADGELTDITTPRSLLPLLKTQSLIIGGTAHTIWFPPDDLGTRAGLQYRQSFRKGDPVVRLKVKRGDYLFVDRMTYNFRPPQRGEIVVFATKGIAPLPQDQYYIKRLVGLSDEKVQIGNDQHLIINGEKLTAANAGFEHLYSFGEFRPELYNHQYFGHANDSVGRKYTPAALAPLFPDEQASYPIRPGYYMAMGDNTLNSRDSREWGDFPRENIIGRSYFVYWPFSNRFGWRTR